MSVEPYTFDRAREVSAVASRQQAQAEQDRRDASEAHAEKERVYRQALAKRIVEAHHDGVAWTVAQDIARGDPHVAKLRYERDVAKGVLDAAEQRAWRHTADRKDAHLFAEWSMRRDLAEGYGRTVEPKDMSVIGGRAA